MSDTAEKSGCLISWESVRAGPTVLVNCIELLREEGIAVDEVLYLVSNGSDSDRRKLPNIDDVGLKVVEVDVDDPTDHSALYRALRNLLLPKLRGLDDVHINLSPGTPAMHAVWLVLHAGGAFPDGTRLWATQYIPDENKSRLDRVEFPVSTYMAEIRRELRRQPGRAAYEPEARSEARRSAFDKLARYARIPGAPLLVLGERGTGKSRLVETFVARLKGREQVVSVPCGALQSQLADSMLFGHVKGAFTGAGAEREGMLGQADGGILFLDEVQDLPKQVQRKLVRVFQDRRRRYRKVGADEETEVDVELVCASNLPISKLREELDEDFFDRLSHLVVEVPPLRRCRDDIEDDWRRVWDELCLDKGLGAAPWNSKLRELLQESSLSGNFRDLQRLAYIVMSWLSTDELDEAVGKALEEWRGRATTHPLDAMKFGSGTRDERTNWFQAHLAQWAKEKCGTWVEAAKVLECDESTLRRDAKAVTETE